MIGDLAREEVEEDIGSHLIDRPRVIFGLGSLG